MIEGRKKKYLLKIFLSFTADWSFFSFQSWYYQVTFFHKAVLFESCLSTSTVLCKTVFALTFQSPDFQIVSFLGKKDKCCGYFNTTYTIRNGKCYSMGPKLQTQADEAGKLILYFKDSMPSFLGLDQQNQARVKKNFTKHFLYQTPTNTLLCMPKKPSRFHRATVKIAFSL